MHENPFIVAHMLTLDIPPHFTPAPQSSPSRSVTWRHFPRKPSEEWKGVPSQPALPVADGFSPHKFHVPKGARPPTSLYMRDGCVHTIQVECPLFSSQRKENFFPLLPGRRIFYCSRSSPWNLSFSHCDYSGTHPFSLARARSPPRKR